MSKHIVGGTFTTAMIVREEHSAKLKTTLGDLQVCASALKSFLISALHIEWLAS